MQTPSPKERVVSSASARVESPDDRVRQYEFRLAERAKAAVEELKLSSKAIRKEYNVLQGLLANYRKILWS